MRRLQSLYNHLQSEHPDLPTSIGDHPEDLLTQLYMSLAGEGPGKQGGLYFLDGVLDNTGGNVDWDLAYNEGINDIAVVG